MSKMYPKIEDGELIKIQAGDFTISIACCDCGLVHTWTCKSLTPTVVSIERNGRATAQLRRHRNGDLFEDHPDNKWKIVRKRQK